MARDGNEALAQCSVERPDIVLTDIVMPDKEGLETIRERSFLELLEIGVPRVRLRARELRAIDRAPITGWSHAEIGC